jgi:hypothetical protein
VIEIGGKAMKVNFYGRPIKFDDEYDRRSMMTLCEPCSKKVHEAVDKKAATNSSQEKAGNFHTSGRHESAME